MNGIIQRQKTTSLGKDLIACFKLGNFSFFLRIRSACEWQGKRFGMLGISLTPAPGNGFFNGFFKEHVLSTTDEYIEMMNKCEMIWQVWS